MTSKVTEVEVTEVALGLGWFLQSSFHQVLCQLGGTLAEHPLLPDSTPQIALLAFLSDQDLEYGSIIRALRKSTASRST